MTRSTDGHGKLPFFAALDDSSRTRLRAGARIVNVPAGARVFEPGQSADAFLFVTRGRVRVQLTAENGREIMLYRVEVGEGCVLTTSGLLDSESYAAEALCETDVEAIALPKTCFQDLLGSSTVFRDAVLSAYAARVADLILTIEETRFHRIEPRLANHILEQATDNRINATHQELAASLGTAREVVSRTLKRFERTGTIALARGLIEIKNRTELLRLAQSV